ncbi:NAD(P)H-binding protein [Propionibacterium freudenreichii]|uniref:NAD(P)-dependent oxidoreductase n=1 Tax=Propionibacterium freudenreichii TaxID=1744 RepID=UPI000BC2D7D9|nr:NAD(P)H-binding protein [Propionibacterium freudenreichii]MDK9294803.1 NAD(P)H-binding protein [Propionibacterium freudenreichii]MDK9360175.1 NAD(P)H-binding protein [Propionibacterium freudenreichii]MDK9640146.1 NAD(P)H-binding protein [Propionibacterium freudenreichii]WGU89836.1 NAD(P)H-binding protein [Propionibacterium freudenreichii]SCQ75304.1 Azoreductase B [Propionibacterium freudenreichii]
MRITIFGATGHVGSQITAEALRRGHQVTAVSHSGKTVADTTPAQANFDDTPAVVELANQADVTVISVPPSRTADEPIEVNLDAHQRLIDAAPDTRIVVVGGAGSLLVDGVPLRDTPGFPDAYRREATWGIELLKRYRQAPVGVDWLIVSPSPEIGPGERTGQYVVGTDSPVGDHITTQDFAVGILDEIEAPAHHRMRTTLADK